MSYARTNREFIKKRVAIRIVVVPVHCSAFRKRATFKFTDPVTPWSWCNACHSQPAGGSSIDGSPFGGLALGGRLLAQPSKRMERVYYVKEFSCVFAGEAGGNTSSFEVTERASICEHLRH